MTTHESNVNRTNWAMVTFTIVVGILLITNLFEYLTWEIWSLGIYIAGGIFFANILYRILRKKEWAYKRFQILIFFLILSLISHTVLAVTSPGYLDLQRADLTAYETYSERMELTTTYYPEVVSHKKLKATINDREYTITDSSSNFFYLRMHPPKGDNSNIFMGHRVSNSELQIEVESAKYNLSPIQNLLRQHPTIILGMPQIPLELELNTRNEGILNVDLKKQRVEILRGLFQEGLTNIKLSVDSLPKTKFIITSRGGETIISLPREIGHTIKYSTRENSTLIIEGNEVVRSGEYEIISGENQNPCKVEVNVDAGMVKILTH